jgi:hypothetical protein
MLRSAHVRHVTNRIYERCRTWSLPLNLAKANSFLEWTCTSPSKSLTDAVPLSALEIGVLSYANIACCLGMSGSEIRETSQQEPHA